MIYANEVGEGGLEFDYDRYTGDLYAAVNTYHPTNDSLIVFRSTDDGDTWLPFMVCTNTDGSIDMPLVRVASHDGNTWIMAMGIWREPGGEDVLWSRRIRSNGSGAVYEQVTASDVDYADLDADCRSGALFHAVFIPQGSADDIWYARNELDGSGWVDAQVLFQDPEMDPFPEVSSGTYGGVYVAFLDDRVSANQQIRLKRSTNSGVDWLPSQQVGDNSGGYGLSFSDIAASLDTIGVVWIACTYNLGGGNQNVGFYYSTNSGSSWNYGSTFGGTSGTDTRSSLRCDKNDGSVSLAYLRYPDPENDILFTWTTRWNPDGFGSPVEINDAEATVYDGPAAGWTSDYPAVIYSRQGSNGAYFDSSVNTGIEEGSPPVLSGTGSFPNPFTTGATIRFSLLSSSPVSVSVFDLGGRLVGVPEPGRVLGEGEHSVAWSACGCDGSPLLPGVYLCRIDAGADTTTLRMVLLR